MDNFTKKLIDKVYAAHQHSQKMFLETGDKEYLGQEHALAAVLTTFADEADDTCWQRLNHLSTFVKKEHRP